MSAPPSSAARDEELKRRRVVEETARLEAQLRVKGVSSATLTEALEMIYVSTNAMFGDVNARFTASGAFKAECAAGCSFCCHTMVTAHEAEAFLLADYAGKVFAPEALAALKSRVLETDAQTRGKGGAWRYVNHVPCPMLNRETGFCSIHPARPIACRALHSGSRSACQKAYDRRDATIPTPSLKLFFQQSEIYHAAFRQALARFGVTSRTLDLNAALAIIWSAPEPPQALMARWLAGEPVFAAAEARLAAA